MNIIARGRLFVQQLKEWSQRSALEWRRCPHCGSWETKKIGGYWVHPYTLEGRQEVRVQRHWCHSCGRSYSERSERWVEHSWYGRDVHRFSVDLWQHGGASLRKAAEVVRSFVGKQERWQWWHPWEERPPEEKGCRLSQSTVARWLDRAGMVAQESLAGQWEGVSSSGQVGADGLWARLVGGGKRVVLVLSDAVTGLLYPPVVVKEEESASGWGELFARAKLAGLDLEQLRGLTSDGAVGLLGCVQEKLSWVNHQRCHFHLWRKLKGELALAVQGAAGEVREEARKELTALVRGVLEANSYEQAEARLAQLRAHELGGKLAQWLQEHLDAALVYLLPFNWGLLRVSPEWYWRDFRLRVSRGRNHRSALRLERATCVWAIYRDFEPAQRRSERKRKYRHPGLSPLAVAGAPPGEVSYLDALAV